MQFGPVNVASPWPANWFGAPVGPKFLKPSPAGVAGGHSYTIVGWETYDGVLYVTCVNSWGAWGSRQGIFRFPIKWLFEAPLGPQIVWKVTDMKDAPTPPPPPPVETEVLPIYDAAPFDQAVDLLAGVQLYETDGKTPMVKLSTTTAGIRSPFATSATQRLIRIRTGGVVQAALVATSVCKNMRPFVTPTDVKHTVETRVDGVTKWKEII
jgi:hypothetical protein